MIRGAVGAAVALAVPAGLAGCGLLGGEPEPEPEPDPLAGLLAATLELVGRYDAAMTTAAGLGPLLTPVVATHRAHAEELSRLTGIALPAPTTAAPGGQPTDPGTAVPGPGTSAPPGDRAAVLTALRSAEEAAATEAAAACHTAAADRAALLGSIAAARTCHLEVLR
ncbi:hypothetical protein O7543_10705 [Solwaraspora sp. WMMA2080]|nr:MULTISPECIES: hypothetical protein [unclassified Solwaraspora]WBC00199.1 hypothetical protein O7553_06660 [Solwaraspora sp. WMMA2059]WBC23731.1 hypothetical protein O7543_10705 [Solwaraspora sp. WMMA2080]WJK37588.1 hypothetical protein O7610_01465 [Solwaraspora sp. WMMA2065]